MPKLGRRSLLLSALGATQAGLLGRYGLLGKAHAVDPNGPSRLLSIYVPGGYTPMNLFCPLDGAMIDAELPGKETTLGETVFFGSGDVEDLAPAVDGFRPVRVVRTWNPMQPSSRDDGYLPLGYSYREHALHEQLVAVHGVDQGSVAHSAGHISAMCGVPGPTFRAPAFQAVVANALAQRFPERPLPSVALDARSVPNPLTLPASASPIVAGSADRVQVQLSDSPDVNQWWQDLDARTERPAVAFDGTPDGNIATTRLEQFVIDRLRERRGPNPATDAFLERAYGSLKRTSNVLAQDVVSVIEGTPGVENLPEDCTYGGETVRGYNRFGFTFGLANGSDGRQYDAPFDFALRLMKSDLSSAIHLMLPVHNHDTHSATGHANGFLRLRADFDAIGRLLAEMKMTTSPSRPERTLLEDTLVVVFSEFSRTWWQRGDDHWQHSSVFFAGGGVGANRSIGNFTTDRPGPGGFGVPVSILEEDGSMNDRVPRSADFVATVYRAMGLGFEEFFIPGGYGEIVGVRAG